MKNKSVLQALKFTLFSASAGIVQMASFALLNNVLGLESYWLSHVPSLVLSVLWNFTFNRKYTFKPTSTVKRDMLLVALFYVVFTPASAWWGEKLVALGLHEWLVEILNMAVNFITEFLFQKFVVYPEKKDEDAVCVD